MPAYFTAKEEQQYEHIKSSCLKSKRYCKRKGKACVRTCKRIAAATVNKYRGTRGLSGITCRRVGKLTAEKRRKLKSSDFGLPGTRQYPMPDPRHAANAKARARQQLDRGTLSRASYNRIVAHANRVIARCR